MGGKNRCEFMQKLHGQEQGELWNHRIIVHEENQQQKVQQLLCPANYTIKIVMFQQYR